MKPSPQSIPQAGHPTITTVVHWAKDLEHLHARIASRFARPEPRRRALLYLQGVLSTIERKNGWQLAEHAQEATPYGMQRLLSQAVWDTDGVRDDLRHYVVDHLGSEGAVVVIDESSFPKRGTKSAGVQVQYCGTTGAVENCQVGVFLSYVTARGHTLIDRELYLPLAWLADQPRCQQAGVPASVRFQTKPELAMAMLERLWAMPLAIAWVVADTVYGSNLELRTCCERHGCPYVLAVACTEPVGVLTSDGQRRRIEVREVAPLLLHEQDWQRLSMGDGTKGPRLFDWACVPMLHQWEADGRHWVLLRRCLNEPRKLAYYFVFAPPTTTLPEMVRAIGARWHIEEDFETSKDLGLDHYEVRSYLGWYRHITLVMLAHAFATAICAQRATSPAASPPRWVEAEGAPDATAATRASALVALTVPEVRHLLGQLIWPTARSVRVVLAWSWWRRCHGRRASYYHTKRRLEAG